MRKYSVTLFAALAFAAGSANAQPLVSNVENALEVVIVNTTGGSLPGDPSNLGGDIENTQNFLNDVTGTLTDGDLNAVLAETIENTTGGQPPGDPSNIDGDIENISNFGEDLINALTAGQELPGL